MVYVMHTMKCSFDLWWFYGTYNVVHTVHKYDVNASYYFNSAVPFPWAHPL